MESQQVFTVNWSYRLRKILNPIRLTLILKSKKLKYDINKSCRMEIYS